NRFSSRWRSVWRPNAIGGGPRRTVHTRRASSNAPRARRRSPGAWRRSTPTTSRRRGTSGRGTPTCWRSTGRCSPAVPSRTSSRYRRAASDSARRPGAPSHAPSPIQPGATPSSLAPSSRRRAPRSSNRSRTHNLRRGPFRGLTASELLRIVRIGREPTREREVYTVAVAGSGPFSREETPDSEHVVQFYESDAFLAEVVSRFVVEGLAAGEAVVVIATGAHRRDVEQRLRARGVDPAAAGREARYVALDAAETLARFMIDARPDPVRFDEVLSAPILRASAGGGRRVRAFGEMVALLGAQGNFEGAIRLEALWNELSCRLPFSL